MRGLLTISFFVSVIYLKIVIGDNLAEKQLSEYITTILNHYKQDDPVGAPLVPIPEPLDVPDLTQSLGFGSMQCNNISLFGLSKFRIDYINAELVTMQIKAGIKIESLDILGNFTVSSWLSKSRGNFTIHLTNVTIEATSGLEVQEDDQLEAQEIYMDFINENITMDFDGLGYLEKGVVGSSGAFIFESSKPYMIREMNAKLRDDINKQVKLIPQKFPKPVAPLDQLIAKARAHVRANSEPLKLDDFDYATTISKIRLTHTWLHGLSNFHRIGDVNIEVRNKTIVFKLHVGATNLNGSTHWEVSLMNGRRAGTAGFSLDDFEVEIIVRQPMDTTKPPELEDINLSLGEIRIGFNGAGVYDFPLLVVANFLPQLLNQQIVDGLELIVKVKLRQVFTEVSLDEVILGNLGKLDELHRSGRLMNLLTQ